MLFAIVNFNYSYRAFLISCLLMGNLALLLVSVTLSGEEQNAEAFTTVEYMADLPLEEEPLSEKIKIETNTAYNEAEKFIAELENSRNKSKVSSEENKKLNTILEPIPVNNDLAINDARYKLNEVKEKLTNNAKKELSKTKPATINRKTTTSYHLKGRDKISLPIPVYTCDKGGKIVITIEVNEMGKVVKTSYNKAASTTSNGCLIESAINYANRSKFSASKIKKKQLGTITYL
ncbi:MAG: hypothetical protein JKY22_01440, partial [Flavobacteriaceae bacterium]|nr:hypothetical protein [Flavobacteriaceae bacterium]